MGEEAEAGSQLICPDFERMSFCAKRRFLLTDGAASAFPCLLA